MSPSIASSAFPIGGSQPSVLPDQSPSSLNLLPSATNSNKVGGRKQRKSQSQRKQGGKKNKSRKGGRKSRKSRK
jgi:hypothetical protein